MKNILAAPVAKKLPAIYEIRKLFTVFRRARRWAPYWSSWIIFTATHPSSLRCILILLSLLCLGLPSGPFSWEFTTKNFVSLCMSYLGHMYFMFRPSNHLDFITRLIANEACQYLRRTYNGTSWLLYSGCWGPLLLAYIGQIVNITFHIHLLPKSVLIYPYFFYMPFWRGV